MPGEKNQESIGFLIGALLRRKRISFRALLEPFKVTPRQYAVLSRLWQEESLALTDLAKRLYADPSSLSRTLVLMEKSDLIKRQRDDEDRRVFRLTLSTRGRALKRRLRPLVQAHEEEMVKGLSPAEIDVVADAMRRMLENLGGTSVDGNLVLDDDEP
jgi:DNA-binding MarR family transcriptional regulator